MKFTNCKIREHVSSMKSNLKGVNFIKEKSDENHRNSEKDYLYGKENSRVKRNTTLVMEIRQI